ncbi:MAG: hypothetical protein ABUL73_04270 [Alphaproteobacteria bacterium]
MKSILPMALGVVAAAFVTFLLGVAAGVNGERPGFVGIAVGMTVGAAVILLLNNLSGNRKTEQADPEARRKALAFEPAPDRAALYLVRTGFVGKAAGMNLAVDGKTVVQLKSPRFARIDLAPGGHKLTASFGGGLASQTNPSEFDFNVAAGEIVVLKLTLGFGAVKAPISIERIGAEAVRSQLPGMTMVRLDVAA